jgi:hypothetical protein
MTIADEGWERVVRAAMAAVRRQPCECMSVAAWDMISHIADASGFDLHAKERQLQGERDADRMEFEEALRDIRDALLSGHTAHALEIARYRGPT